MKLRAIFGVALLAVLVGAALPGSATATGQPLAGSAAAQPRLNDQRFASIDPVMEALIPVYRKNQAAALVRRALADLQRRCRALDGRDRLQRAVRLDCTSLVRLNRVILQMGRCRGYTGCGRVLARAGRIFGRSAVAAKRANAIYRRKLRGACLKSFATPRRELHLLNRLSYRVTRLAVALKRRDPVAIFVEQLLWDQLLAEIDDDGPTARDSWRAFREACRPRPPSPAPAEASSGSV